MKTITITIEPYTQSAVVTLDMMPELVECVGSLGSGGRGVYRLNGTKAEWQAYIGDWIESVWIPSQITVHQRLDCEPLPTQEWATLADVPEGICCVSRMHDEAVFRIGKAAFWLDVDNEPFPIMSTFGLSYFTDCRLSGRRVVITESEADHA